MGSVSRLCIDVLERATPTEIYVLVDQPRLLGLGIALNAENVIEYE